jgi:hypothetical protein
MEATTKVDEKGVYLRHVSDHQTPVRSSVIFWRLLQPTDDVIGSYLGVEWTQTMSAIIAPMRFFVSASRLFRRVRKIQ